MPQTAPNSRLGAWGRALAAICLLLSACTAPEDNRLGAVKRAGELVVLTRNSPTTFYEGPDGPTGFEYDLSARAFAQQRPTAAKYLLAGWVSQAEITAAYLVKAGHRGDLATLDGDYGFWRYADSSSWDADSVVAALGNEWRFPRATPLKLYPCCRIMHGALDCLAAIIERNGLCFQEIDSLNAYLEASCTEPVFSNRDIRDQTDAQFSGTHGTGQAHEHLPSFQ